VRTCRTNCSVGTCSAVDSDSDSDFFFFFFFFFVTGSRSDPVRWLRFLLLATAALEVLAVEADRRP
jgi:hypothetical protein